MRQMRFSRTFVLISFPEPTYRLVITKTVTKRHVGSGNEIDFRRVSDGVSVTALRMLIGSVSIVTVSDTVSDLFGRIFESDK